MTHEKLLDEFTKELFKQINLKIINHQPLTQLEGLVLCMATYMMFDKLMQELEKEKENGQRN